MEASPFDELPSLEPASTGGIAPPSGGGGALESRFRVDRDVSAPLSCAPFPGAPEPLVPHARPSAAPPKTIAAEPKTLRISIG